MHQKVHLFLNRDVFFFGPECLYLLSRPPSWYQGTQKQIIHPRATLCSGRKWIVLRDFFSMWELMKSLTAPKKCPTGDLNVPEPSQNDYNLHGLPEKTEANDSAGRNVRLWNVLIIYLQRGKFTLLFIFLSRGINNDK